MYGSTPPPPGDEVTMAKWPSKESFATHPSTETEWSPKRLTRFRS